MASLDQLPWKYRLLLAAYPWRRVDPTPWSSLQKPLTEARVALCTSAGLTIPGDAPFDGSVRGGDCSFRIIPDGASTAALRCSHRSGTFDHSGLERDPNLGFPLDRLHELVERGRIGSASPRHLSFMGSITAPGRLVKESAPAMASQLVEDAVDVVVFVPV